MRLKKLQKAIVDALEDIKARDIEVFDVRKLTALFDYVVIATAESGRQLRALSVHVQEAVKGVGGRVVGTEGENVGEWVLVDCDDTVVHVMQPAIRQHYNLEELWASRAAESAEVKPSRAKKDGATKKPRARGEGAAKKPRAAKEGATKKPRKVAAAAKAQ